MDFGNYLSQEFIRSIDTNRYWTTVLLTLVVVLIFYVNTGLFYRKLRRILDTPTSKVRSAAQGYVELVGIQHHYQKSPLIAPLTKEPCTWYRYLVQCNNGKEWVTIEEEVSSDLILFEDSTGNCVIDPDGAEITPALKTHEKKYQYISRLEYAANSYSMLNSREYAYTEWRMEPGSILYVMGNYRTLESLVDENSVDSDAVSLLLHKWKQNPKALLQKYDKDGDGKLNEDEWEVVEQDAQKEIEKNNVNEDKDLTLNLVSKEGLSRRQPYIISNYRPAFLIFNYKIYTYVGLVLSFFSSYLFIWLLVARHLSG